MSEVNSKEKIVVTPEFRAAFPAVMKARSYNNQEAKYSITMLFNRSTDLTILKKAVAAAAKEKWGPKEQWPKNLRLPFRSGDEKAELQGFKGTIFVRASSNRKPGLVDNNVDPIIREEDFYGGCYARAEIGAFAYDNAGNKGVSFGLNHVQKLRDGEAFDGRRDVSEVFSKVADTSEDPSSYDEEVSDDALSL